MKKKSWLIMLILIFYIFQPIMALSEDYTQKEEAAQELPENEEPDTLDSHESVSEEEDSMEEATWDTEIDSTPEESWQHDDTPGESFTDNDRQESEEQEESPQPIEQRSEIQGSWGTVPWTYDEETNTMTLYEGDGGTTLNTPWRAYQQSLEQIIVAGRVRLPSNSSSLFSSTPNLRSIQNEHNFDTSQVTNMMSMFHSTSSLKSLDLSTWDTRLVTDLRNFVYNSGIEALDVSGFDTRAVTNLRGMFVGATNLKELTLGEKSIFYMPDDFWSVANLPDVPITERYTGRWVLRESLEWEADLIAYDTSYEFISNYDGSHLGTYVWEERERALWGTVPWEYDESSKTITLFGGNAGLAAFAPWKTHSDVERIIVQENVVLPTNSGRLFESLVSLSNIEGAEKFDTSSVTSMESMFSGASSLVEINLEEWNTTNVRTMAGLFSGASSLESLDLTNWNTSSVRLMTAMFANATSLTDLKVSNWNTSYVEMMRSMFSNTRSLRELNISNWNVGEVQSMNAMFDGSGITKLDLNSWNTENVTNMGSMFRNMSNLTELSISEWNTENVTVMTAMFSGTTNLTELANIGNWKTSRVTDMGAMFSSSALRELSIDEWDVSRVSSMTSMFANTSLNYLDLGNWNTSSLVNISWMFNGARDLETVYVNNWDTSRVTNMNGVFLGASSITSLDLSSWATQNVSPNFMTNLFGGMTSLRTLTLGERSIFGIATGLPAVPINDEFTGRWILEDSNALTEPIAFSSSTQLLVSYDGSYPGTYVWERVALNDLVAEIDPVSDQSESITGYMTESVSELLIKYENTSGNMVVIEKDSPRIEWGDYQDEQQIVRYFKINLAENERLETDTEVIIFLARSSSGSLIALDTSAKVIKGIEYRANNITLDRLAINDLASNDELHQMILRESRASAKNLLTEADLSSEIRVIETDLTRDTTIDGTYYARLEVGNKAYQFWIGIDVSSKLGHLKVTIPTKMIFESLYDDAESNRSFESADYEIQNQSRIPVDTYVTQLAITDDAGITLLAEGESPLDYVTPIHQDQASESGIPIPLLRLSIKTEEAEVQLSERMAEQHFVRLSQRSHVPVKLSGHYYGPYPRWITDDQMQQGGYYEESLAPKYQIILRFVP